MAASTQRPAAASRSRPSTRVRIPASRRSMRAAKRAIREAARRHGEVLYAVPGSPAVAERTVELLRAEAQAGVVDVVVHAALSFADLAWVRLGIDPVRTLDAYGDVDTDGASIDCEGADHGQRAVVDGVLDRTDRGFGVVAAMAVVAGAHLEDHALQRHRVPLTASRAARWRRHWRSPSCRSRPRW